MLVYEPFSVAVQFELCETRRCVTISIVRDEPEESFNYTLERTPDLDSRISLDPVEGEVVIVGQCPGVCDGGMINPRRACAARVTLCVCVSVCYRSSSYSVRFSLQPTASTAFF